MAEVNSPGLRKSSRRSLSIVTGGNEDEVGSPGNDHKKGVIGEDERCVLLKLERRKFHFA